MACLEPESPLHDDRPEDANTNDLLLTADGQNLFTSYDVVYDTFESMGLHENVLRSIYAYGFEKPWEMQKRGIVPFTKGLDVIQLALAGDDCLSTFCAGILQRLDYGLVGCQAVILARFSERVREIERFLQALGFYLGVKVHASVFGIGVAPEQKIMSKGVHVVVGTPMRVLSMLRRQQHLDNIKMFVLDKADNMLKGGFKYEIYDIFQLFPSKVQVGLFADTMRADALEVIAKIMNNPVIIPS